ncbi:MAG: aldo/keto reductase [Armatimonadetes bacterium]|nr:aldo/keto reductase [Armatimonadota bacterium]
MKYRSLGRTGVQVSSACLGTMTFGWEPDDWGSTEAQAYRIADKALDLGVNFFDCADVYARGTSEKILGKWMKGKRKELVIATKCHGRMSDTDPNAWGNSRRHVIEACEASLKRLKTDYIDLYQIHRAQPAIPIDETLRALDDLVRQGKIRYAGCSTFAGWQAAEAHYVAKSLGISGFVCEQPPYNLLDRRIERGLLPFCRTYGWAVIPWSPLAGGQLSGKYLDKRPRKARYVKSDPFGRINPQTARAVRRLKKIADAEGMSMATMSLAWVAGQPGITAPIIGARSVKQLKESVEACQTELGQDVMDRIDKAVEPGSHVLEYYEADFGPNAVPSC